MRARRSSGASSRNWVPPGLLAEGAAVAAGVEGQHERRPAQDGREHRQRRDQGVDALDVHDVVLRAQRGPEQPGAEVPVPAGRVGPEPADQVAVDPLVPRQPAAAVGGEHLEVVAARGEPAGHLGHVGLDAADLGLAPGGDHPHARRHALEWSQRRAYVGGARSRRRAGRASSSARRGRTRAPLGAQRAQHPQPSETARRLVSPCSRARSTLGTSVMVSPARGEPAVDQGLDLEAVAPEHRGAGRRRRARGRAGRGAGPGRPRRRCSRSRGR